MRGGASFRDQLLSRALGWMWAILWVLCPQCRRKPSAVQCGVW